MTQDHHQPDPALAGSRQLPAPRGTAVDHHQRTARRPSAARCNRQPKGRSSWRPTKGDTRMKTEKLPAGIIRRPNGFRISVQVAASGPQPQPTACRMPCAWSSRSNQGRSPVLGTTAPHLCGPSQKRGNPTCPTACQSPRNLTLSSSKWYGKTILDFYGPNTSLDAIKGVQRSGFL